MGEYAVYRFSPYGTDVRDVHSDASVRIHIRIRLLKERTCNVEDPQRKHGEKQYLGPFTVDRVYDNGTLRLTRATTAGAVYQTTG